LLLLVLFSCVICSVFEAKVTNNNIVSLSFIHASESVYPLKSITLFFCQKKKTLF
jgi:hypothetical protein